MTNEIDNVLKRPNLNYSSASFAKFFLLIFSFIKKETHDSIQSQLHRIIIHQEHVYEMEAK